MKSQRAFAKIWTGCSPNGLPPLSINHQGQLVGEPANYRPLAMINPFRRHKLIGKERAPNLEPIACQQSSSCCGSTPSSDHLVWSPGSNRLIATATATGAGERPRLRMIRGDQLGRAHNNNISIRKSPQNRSFSRELSTINRLTSEQQAAAAPGKVEKQDNNTDRQPRVTLYHECCSEEKSGPDQHQAQRDWSFESCKQVSGDAATDSVECHSPSGRDTGGLARSREARAKDNPVGHSQLLSSRENHERIIWRAARDYQQTDHYDHSLFGLDANMDQAVARHQREAMLYNQDRHLKEEQAKKVAPNQKQSPISIMSVNPTYVLNNKPLVIEYPATVENLRLNNTGFSWEVKLPYQISMTTALSGGHLSTAHRYRLDQFHCHWGDSNEQGSEHSVDNHFYSAELHFVHYNMEKYHTFSKAARHSDGLVVLSVFIDAHEDHHNHAELEKIVAHLKQIQLKGEHSIIKQAVRIENLLPANRSYWSYQGSLTTPPYLESVTWFVLKQPIRCSQAQIDRFRNIKSSLRHDEGVFIKSNHRRTQPLNGRTIVMYDEPMAAGIATTTNPTSATSRGILRSN